MSFLTTPDGTRLRFSDRGSGPTIVLVHGWKGSHRLWDQTAHHLLDRHRVVRFDLRGMGESDKPRGPYDFDVYAADVGFVLRELGVQDATMVGWSMGCTVALSYLDVDGHGVGRVVLNNGPLRLTQADDFPHAMPAEQFDGYVEQLASAWPASEREFQAASVLPDADPLLVDWLYEVALQTPLDVALEIVRSQAKLDMRESVARLRVPALAVYSDREPYYPLSLAEYIAQTAPDGRMAVLHQSAHAAPLEEPATYAALLAAFAAGDDLPPSTR
jgi:non-heme chloroperoxidase